MRIVSLFLLLLIHLGTSAQTKTANFKATAIKDGSQFDLTFKAADNILYGLEISADQMKQPIMLRVDKRLPNGISFAEATDIRSTNRLIVEIGSDILTIRDAQNNKMAYAHWVYDGPINGVGTDCGSCLDKEQSFALLRKAKSTN